MEKEIKNWLSDMLNAIEEIEQFYPARKDFTAFQKDIKTKRAIERNIEIIGEAVNRVLKIDNEFPITHARKIIDTRNRIIHGYDTVSDEIIWSIVVRDLPDLKNEIIKLLDK